MGIIAKDLSISLLKKYSGVRECVSELTEFAHDVADAVCKNNLVGGIEQNNLLLFWQHRCTRQMCASLSASDTMHTCHRCHSQIKRFHEERRSASAVAKDVFFDAFKTRVLVASGL
jgi:hypothetical protein